MVEPDSSETATFADPESRRAVDSRSKRGIKLFSNIDIGTHPNVGKLSRLFKYRLVRDLT